MKKIVAYLLTVIMCISMISTSAFATRDFSLEQKLGNDLKSLSLFMGSNNSFNLDAAPTRVEAVVMIDRLLGKDIEINKGNWPQPFVDVPGWADKYIGYAYEKGLVRGVSESKFGSDTANAATYLTYVLRALGYSDTNGADFTYNDPFTLAKSLNILPARVDITNFLRADLVLISYAALSAKLKDSSQSLSEKLISEGVFTKEEFDKYYDPNAFSSSKNAT